MSNSFDINKLNTLISQATDSLMCNSECKKQREAEKLKQIYLNSQVNMETIKNQEQIAQKNYVIFTQGDEAYNNLRENELQQQAQSIADKFAEKIYTEISKIKRQIDTYDGLILNFENIIDLFMRYRNENKKMIKELKENTNIVFTNERKTYYQDQNVGTLRFYYFYILLSIYIICVISFCGFSLFYPTQTSLKIKIAILISFIALPFISSWILSTLLYLAYEVYKFFPTNVYK